MQLAFTRGYDVASEHAPDEGRLIIDRIASGDRNALAELYVRYQRPLFRYLCHMTPDRGLAEEILQDTLVAVWQSAERFEGRSTVQTWLIGIARRQAHNVLRRRGVAIADEAALDLAVDTAPTPDQSALASAEHAELNAALRAIPAIHREILALSFDQGLSYQEIAQVLGIPEGTVKSRLSNAKRALRAELNASRVQSSLVGVSEVESSRTQPPQPLSSRIQSKEETR